MFNKAIFQCTFNVHSMSIQYTFNTPNIWLMQSYLLTYLLSYPKSRDAIASNKLNLNPGIPK